MKKFVKWQTINPGDLLMISRVGKNTFLILSNHVSLNCNSLSTTIEADNDVRSVKNMLRSYNVYAPKDLEWQLIKCGA